MPQEGGVRIEPLSAHHDRDGFACGEAALDLYIRTQAGQDDRRGMSRIFVAVEETGKRVVGFYTLSAAGIAAVSLPADAIRGLPRYPIPAALIGRLAVDVTWHGRGLGNALLADALNRALVASDNVAIRVVVVDAKNDTARAFYEHFGFRPLTDDARRLFMILTPAHRKTR